MRTAARKQPAKQKSYGKIAVFCFGMLAVAFLFFLFAPSGKDKVRMRFLPQEKVAVSVYHEQNQKIEETDLESYLLHVLAGEMPASYESEALKAQAVAARTYAVSKLRAFGGTGCSKGDADLCTSGAHCQSYLEEAEMQTRWGDDYEAYRSKLERAVQETAGEILVYQGKPILALYHASSGGKTEDVAHVFRQALPYLVSVDSEESAAREETVSFSANEFLTVVQKKYPESGLTKETLQSQVRILSRFESGRVETLQLGKVSISGKEARGVFGLKSSNFDLSLGETIVFHTIGYGHGVGMSQMGANQMAKEGANYEKILLHYYTGVSIARFSDLFSKK